jgi:hypothetical protein
MESITYNKGVEIPALGQGVISGILEALPEILRVRRGELPV